MGHTASDHRQKIHQILAHSYLVYFLASLLGLCIDVFIPFHVTVAFATPIAIGCFLVGPALIFWAQYTSRHYVGANTTAQEYFRHGPYRYMRNPTHVGLLVLVSGYTFVSGSLFFFTMTLVGFLVSNIFFTKYESILRSTYGTYQSYKSRVPKIF